MRPLDRAKSMGMLNVENVAFTRNNKFKQKKSIGEEGKELTEKPNRCSRGKGTSQKMKKVEEILNEKKKLLLTLHVPIGAGGWMVNYMELDPEEPLRTIFDRLAKKGIHLSVEYAKITAYSQNRRQTGDVHINELLNFNNSVKYFDLNTKVRNLKTHELQVRNIIYNIYYLYHIDNRKMLWRYTLNHL